MVLLKVRILSYVLFAVFYGIAAAFSWHEVIEAWGERFSRGIGNGIAGLWFHRQPEPSSNFVYVGWWILFLLFSAGTFYWLFRLVTFRRDTDYIQRVVNWYEHRCELGWRDN